MSRHTLKASRRTVLRIINSGDHAISHGCPRKRKATAMDTNYSFLADLLNKFQNSPDWVQALWLIALPALCFGLAWTVKEIAVATVRRKLVPSGELLYTIHRDAENKISIFRHSDMPEQIAAENVLLLPSQPRKAKEGNG
jgi:hypothetical protein